MSKLNSHPNADGLIPLGWAGYLLSMPEEWRPLKVGGDAASGSLILGDDEAARLRLAWASVTRRRFNADKALRRAIARPVKGVPLPQGLTPQKIKIAGFDAAFVQRGEEGTADRCVAYCSKTYRVVDAVYHHGTPRELSLFRDRVLPGFTDQPNDQPHRWAFFDSSFVAPAGMLYGSSTLNLGDMRVRLFARGGELFGPSLMVRQIYPASLALVRQKIEQWLQGIVLDDRRFVRGAGSGLSGRGLAKMEPYSCPRGEGAAAMASVRWRARAIFLRAPRRWRFVIFHDKAVDRLVVIQAAHKDPAARDALIDEAIAGLHWASRPS